MPGARGELHVRRPARRRGGSDSRTTSAASAACRRGRPGGGLTFRADGSGSAVGARACRPVRPSVRPRRPSPPRFCASAAASSRASCRYACRRRTSQLRRVDRYRGARHRHLENASRRTLPDGCFGGRGGGASVAGPAAAVAAALGIILDGGESPVAVAPLRRDPLLVEGRCSALSPRQRPQAQPDSASAHRDGAGTHDHRHRSQRRRSSSGRQPRRPRRRHGIRSRAVDGIGCR